MTQIKIDSEYVFIRQIRAAGSPSTELKARREAADGQPVRVLGYSTFADHYLVRPVNGPSVALRAAPDELYAIPVVGQSYLFARRDSGQPVTIHDLHRERYDGSPVTVVRQEQPTVLIVEPPDGCTLRVTVDELYPIGADDESNREPSPDQERAWDLREDEARGGDGLRLREYLDAIDARHRGTQ